MQVVPKLKEPPPQALGPPWMLKSLSMMQMMPYMMSGFPFHGGIRSPQAHLGPFQTPLPIGHRMTASHRALRFDSDSTGLGPKSDVWIRGINDALGTAVDV
jgi:hypothetical protein